MLFVVFTVSTHFTVAHFGKLFYVSYVNKSDIDIGISLYSSIPFMTHCQFIPIIIDQPQKWSDFFWNLSNKDKVIQFALQQRA